MSEGGDLVPTGDPERFPKKRSRILRRKLKMGFQRREIRFHCTLTEEVEEEDNFDGLDVEELDRPRRRKKNRRSIFLWLMHRIWIWLE